MGIGSNLELGVVWKNRTHSGCRLATQSNATVSQGSQVVLEDVLTHGASQRNKGVKREQEQDSGKDVQEHILRRRSLLTGPVLLDQLQNARHLLSELIILLRRRCLGLGSSREVFRNTRDRSRLTDFREFRLIIRVLLRDRQTLRQGLHEVLKSRLLFALAIVGGTCCVLSRLCLGGPLLRRSPLHLFQGRKFHRHPLVFGSPEKCGESSNADEH